MSTEAPSARSSARSWFVGTVRRRAPRLRLYCLPYAGGTSSIYRGWADDLPDDIEIWPVDPPGRWYEPNELPLHSMQALVRELGPVIAGQPPAPYALFGYSLGATVAFELARWLRRQGHCLPQQLYVAAASAPRLPRTAAPLHQLPDQELIDSLPQRYAPLPSAILEDAELRQLVLRTLRADLACLETYRHHVEDPLPIPVTVYGGSRDRHVPPPTLDAWSEETTARFERTMCEGDHFFLQTSRKALLAHLSRALMLRGATA
jgi:medium-chain acyl-[acyl-carrier-protein] hydrolase